MVHLKKIVVGTDKRGDVIAMDAATGKPIWWTVLGTIYGTNVDPQANGEQFSDSRSHWRSTAYHAADNANLIYLATTSTTQNFFLKGQSSFRACNKRN